MIGRVFSWLGRLFLKICTILGFLIILSIAGFWLMTRFKSPQAIPEKTVLTLSLDGAFTEGPSPQPLQLLFEGGSQSFYKLLIALKKAEKDPKVSGLYVNTGTPSLGIAQIQELREAFLSLRKAGKFVYFYTPTFGEMTPSTSFYYLATAADVIGIQPLGSVGLTGLGAEMPFLKKIMETVGVTADFIRHGKYKSYTETFTEEKMSPAFRESLESILVSLSQQVVADLSMGRKIPFGRVQELVKRGPFSDKEAQKNGLVDRLAYESDFEKEVLAKAGEKSTLVALTAYQKIISTSEKVAKSPEVALIFAEGTIVPDREKTGGGGIVLPSSEKIGDVSTLKLFKEIGENPKIKAVVYRIDSGGGHALASDAIGEGLRQLRQKGKKVIVSMGNTAASGGYLIALGADEIVADAGTITGSIGVFFGKFVLSNLWEKWGIYWDHAETAPNARFASMNTVFSEETRMKLQTWVDGLYEVFVARTAQARHLSVEEAGRLAEGRVWTGEQAQKLKLVDHLGGVFVALERARLIAALPENPVIGIYPAPKSLFDYLTSSVLEEGGPGFFTVLSVAFKRALWNYCAPSFSAQFYEEPLKIQ